jgi:hypothetical protein
MNLWGSIGGGIGLGSNGLLKGDFNSSDLLVNLRCDFSRTC